MQPPRQEIEEEHSKGGPRKKVQFHKPNYFWDGGEKNITVIMAPGMRGGREGEVVVEEQGAARRRSQTKAQLPKSSSMYTHPRKESDSLLP